MKATAIAHPIQGLIKYHGLKDPIRRIPFHDSISVCAANLYTKTTIEKDESKKEDTVIVNNKKLFGKELNRVNAVLLKLKTLAGYSKSLKIVSKNNIIDGKGLGFSSSGFAAIGVAACASLGLEINNRSLSEIVRFGAGSATRSLAGGFSIWYSDRDGRSYAEQLAGPDELDLKMIIIPIASSIKTDEAHIEVISSPLFKARLEHIQDMLKEMRRAITNRDIATIGMLAEEDTLNLHAITMTGKSRIILWEPETLVIIKEIIKMRNEGINLWYSLDTGPSVWINTFKNSVNEIVARLQEIGLSKTIISDVGGKPHLSNDHFI